MTQFTVWKREDSDTTPRGFGLLPTYSIDKPYTSECEMIWAEPITCTLPEGYTIAESTDGTTNLYNSKGQFEPIIDYYGHPSIVVGLSKDKNGACVAIHKRLDK